LPARLRFGFEDMALGHSFAAELVRPPPPSGLRRARKCPPAALADRIATSDATVLILGETGTGKEGLARYIHASSPRANGGFVAVNCAALPETMLEAILFGHAKGSFTGRPARARACSAPPMAALSCLDEVAELPLPLQAKLLRALQEKEVLPRRRRPAGADRRPRHRLREPRPPGRSRRGRFRSDLYWRLNVMPLQLQPLAARRLDIRAIAAALIVRQHAPWRRDRLADRRRARRADGA
jgi:two-component system response regulator FlrC